MSFVPVSTYVPPPPSPQARELSAKISATIEEFRRENPGTSPADVEQALRLAAPSVATNRTVAMVAIGLAILAVLGTVFLLLAL
jgi:hypothetical protein